MYVFIDTEFTDFLNCDLISLGAVSEDGQHSFYVEIVDHKVEWQSEFVKLVVVPMLDYKQFGKTQVEAAKAFALWLEDLPSSYVVFVIDFGMDQHLVMDLLRNENVFTSVYVGKPLYFQHIEKAFLHACHERSIHSPEELRKGFRASTIETEQYYSIDPRRHHALVDAMANRYGWVKGMEAARGA